jgi:hypothetical protein
MDFLDTVQILANKGGSLRNSARQIFLKSSCSSYAPDRKFIRITYDRGFDHGVSFCRPEFYRYGLQQSKRVFTCLQGKGHRLAAQTMGLEDRGDEGYGARSLFQSAFRLTIPLHAIHQVSDGGQMVVYRSLDIRWFLFPQSARG